MTTFTSRSSHASVELEDLNEQVVLDDTSSDDGDNLIVASQYDRPTVASVLKQRLIPLVQIALLCIIILLLSIIAAHLPATSQKQYTCVKPPMYPRQTNLSTIPEQKRPILLKNAIILQPTGVFDTDVKHILIQNGIIQKIYSVLEEVPRDTIIIDLNSQLTTPGLIDVQSYAGLYAFPHLDANVELNELSVPVTPQVRAIDSFSRTDMSIPDILQGGVTLSQIAVGPHSLVGGESFLFKTRQNGESFKCSAPHGLKFSLGELPKSESKQHAPFTRMGEASLLRQKLNDAKMLMTQQDIWDCGDKSSPRPRNSQLDAIVSLLRHDPNIMLNVVCYQSSDIEMLLRVAKEFNLKVQVLHDATDAHTMTSTLLENNIKYIAVSQQSNWVGRVEGYYGASHHAIEKLNKAGIQVLIKSDHPFGFHARYLMHHVAISHHYGLPADAALRSVTSTAAKSLGIDTCTGSIVEGMAADLITWDRNPLQLGARVDRVIIDGEVVLEQKIPKLNALGSIDLTSHELQGAVDGVSTFAIKNVRVYTGKQVLDNVNVVVTSGKIICIGNTCTVPEGHPQVTLQGGVLTPGMIEVDSHLGLQEIPSEDNTNDGTSLGSNRISASQVRAADGVRTLGNSKSLENAYRAGILSAVSSPISNAVITGLSVAFDTNCQRPFDQAIIKEEVGLHIGIGAENKQTGTIVSSISGQMNELRGIFSRKTSPTVVRVLSGELPIIAHVNSADNIIQVLRFKALAKVPRMVIVGGAEAHLIAELVARENVSVVLTPWKAMHSAKENWDTMNANMTDFGVETLRKANVKVGLAMGNLHNVHHLRWLAGYARGGSPTSDTSVSEAIASVTSNLAEMFDVPQVGRIQVNSPANFVLFDGNPLSFESRVKLVVSGGVLDVNVAPL